jgi:hypothetical protein
MPIKLTNKDLLESPPSLRKLSEMQIPVRTALKLRKILKVAQADIETVQEQITALGKKHAKRVLDEDGNVKLDEEGKEVLAHPLDKDGKADTSRFELDDLKAYAKEIDDLLDDEVEIAFDPIKAEDLEDRPDPKQPLKQPELKIETSLLFTLHWLISD